MLTLRPAELHDKAAIRALAAKIWEGDDYIHHNFDAWLAQERGRFIVAYDGDTLVGCNKLTEFGPGEWWMEGLRVDPAWRGKGVARRLHENILEIADEIAATEKFTGNLRLATAGDNHAVRKLALETGFSHTNRHLLYKALVPAGKPDSLPFSLATTAETGLLAAWFARSGYFVASHGLFEDNWKWYEMLPRLQQLLADGRIYWWRRVKDTAKGLIVVHHSSPKSLAVNYLEPHRGQWASLLDDLIQLGRHYGVEQLESKPLALDNIKQAIPETGWEIDYDLEMWVFQRPIG